MELADRLREWLQGHPLRDPAEHEPARYTAEVMGRVKALRSGQADASRSRWGGSRLAWGWPRVALAGAAAVAVTLVLVVRGDHPFLRQSGARSDYAQDSALDQQGRHAEPAELNQVGALAQAHEAEPYEREAVFLAMVEEVSPESLLAELWETSEELEEALAAFDALMVSEAPADDESWLEQTMRLLDELDEDLSDEETDELLDEEEWLEELEFFEATSELST